MRLRIERVGRVGMVGKVKLGEGVEGWARAMHGSKEALLVYYI